nr:reverse transcriptase, RNA-dependent DNA polymerase, Gag-polypeptide of LTR copia-type [Tanacetum cinerariifolium]
MRCDAMIKGWLTMAMDKEIRNSVKYAKLAMEIWEDLKERFRKESACKAECGRDGNNKDGCFKIIGYPEWWLGKGKGDKARPRGAMVETKPCLIPGMTEEQYAMFLKLFGENQEEPVIANMAG